MTSVTPEELSGYLDGELSVERTAAVAAALRESPELAQSFIEMRGLDSRWRAAAKSAWFQPKMRLASTALFSMRNIAAAAVPLALAALSLLPQLSDTLALTLGSPAVALALVLHWVVRMIVNEGGALDRRVSRLARYDD